jgi:CRP-like cAMP-binding protein
VTATIDVERVLALAGADHILLNCQRGDVIFSHGDRADSVMYILKGTVIVSVVENRETVVAVLRSGDFYGEECLRGESIRQRKATALTQGSTLVLSRVEMVRLMRREASLTEAFVAYLNRRQARIEEDFIDQVQSSCEQRLARALAILAGFDRHRASRKVVSRISQATLADIVGTTRPRINRLLQKFKALGLIEVAGSITVHRSLLNATSPRVQRSFHVGVATARRPSEPPSSDGK